MQLLRSVLIAAALLCAREGAAQQPSWIPDAQGYRGMPSALYAAPNDGIYCVEVQETQGFRNGQLILHRYNGLFNTQSKPLPVQSLGTGHENAMSVCRYRNRIYVAGSFVSNGHGIRGVAEWDGVRWSAADSGLWARFPVHDEISIYSMAAFQGKLYAAGVFRQSGTRPLRNFASFDSVNWSPIPFPQGTIHALLVQGDTLFAGGNFTSIGSEPAQNLAYLHNDTWHQANVPFKVRALAATPKGMAACSDDSVYLLLPRGRMVLQAGWNYTILRLDALQQAGNTLYASGQFLHRDGSLHHVLQWDGSTWRSVLPAREAAIHPGYPLLLGAWQSELWLAGKITAYRQRQAKNLLKARPGYSMLTGRIFEDLNADCRRNTAERGVPLCIFAINDGQAYYNADSLGNFSFPLRSDTVQHINIFPAQGYALSNCPNHVFRFQPAGKDTAWNSDYSLERVPMPPVPQAQIVPHSGNRARHGYTSSYTLMHGSDRELNGKVSYTFPEGMRLVSADPAPVSVVAACITWSVSDTRLIKVELEVRHDRFLPGDTLHFRLQLPDGGHDSLMQTVVAAYDPNDKHCDPASFHTGTTFLDYHIRFQNLGNDSAVNVFIVDSISRLLPLQFLRVTANSHPSQYNLNYRLQGHAVIWEFKNIMLPPKAAAGDAGSSGFVRFRAGLRSGLQDGDSIFNKAYIYFDFQPAVITNTTRTGYAWNVQTGSSQQALHIWPNPMGSAGEIQLAVPPFTLRRCEVYTADGRLWQEVILPQGTQQWRIPVSHWPAGAYFFRVDYGSGLASGTWFRQ